MGSDGTPRPLAGHFRELAEHHKMSLARLLQDALLAWETNVAAGHQPGATPAEWKAQHGPATKEA